MTRFPSLSAAAEAVPLSMFARLYERLATFKGDVIPLQIGDTYLPPPPTARLCMQAFGEVSDREIYAYAPPAGWPPLIEAITHKVRTRNGLPIETSGVQVTCGATHALSCAVGALLDPGDEIILLSPHWPLIRGIARSRSATPIEVPVSMPLIQDPQFDVTGALEAALSGRTAAIYVSSPNNPDGLVLREETLAQIAAFAERHDLWILSDEVYEDYCYDVPHVSIGRLPAAQERTLTVYSFSKSYAQAGLRVGYCVGPSKVIAAVRKMANHSVYNVPQALQRAAACAIRDGAPFLGEARRGYQEARDLAVAKLAIPVARPEGASYLFIDFSALLGNRASDCMPVLERIAEAGVLLAPGAPFGEVYGNWARLCFSAVERARLVDGIERINAVVQRG